MFAVAFRLFGPTDAILVLLLVAFASGGHLDSSPEDIGQQAQRSTNDYCTCQVELHSQSSKQVVGSLFVSRALQKLTKAKAMFAAAQMYDNSTQFSPMLSTKIPSRTRPTQKPKGCLAPTLYQAIY